MRNNFSLVLGGGSARGLAHIGVFRRLEELYARPNMIIGTSMGALVGAFFACGYSSQDMQNLSKDIGLFSLMDPDFSRGMIQGNKVVAFLESHFGEKTFADTNIPLKIIATSLSDGEKVVLTTGRLVDAIRASISLPGIFVPHTIDGKDLIDGGVSANLAVEEAPKRDRVVAISVQIPLDAKAPAEKSGWFSWEKPFSRLALVMRKTMDIMIIRNETASLMTRPDAYFRRLGHPEIDYSDFDQRDALIAAGYALVRDDLEAYIGKKRSWRDFFSRG